jgi:hypothetical protein
MADQEPSEVPPHAGAVNTGARAPDDSAAVLGHEISEDQGGWWVMLVVGFEDVVIRRRIGPYLTEERAIVAAHHIGRAVGREGQPPTGW